MAESWSVRVEGRHSMHVGRLRVCSHSLSARRASDIGMAALGGNIAPVDPLKIRCALDGVCVELNELAIVSCGSS